MLQLLWDAPSVASGSLPLLGELSLRSTVGNNHRGHSEKCMMATQPNHSSELRDQSFHYLLSDTKVSFFKVSLNATFFRLGSPQKIAGVSIRTLALIEAAVRSARQKKLKD